MKDILDFYKSKTTEIFYLELKSDIYDIDFPLPVLKKDFIKEINTGKFEKSVEFKYFFRGIIFNLAIDKNFVYKDQYLDYLNINNLNIENEVLKLAIEESYEDVETSNIFLKYNYDNFENVNSNYYYAYTLLKLFEKNSEIIFLEESKKVLTKNIELDENFPLNFYLLGNIEIYKNNLIKANYLLLKSKKLIYEFKHDSEIIEEIDRNIGLIRDEVIIEENRSLLEQSKYHKVIDNLKNCDIDDFRIGYYLGNSYFHIGNIEKAKYYYNIANKYSNKEVEFFIDYSYFLAQIGNIVLALDIIDRGLYLYEENEFLLFNRAIVYFNIGENKKAVNDLTNIVQYYDISEDIFNNSMLLLEKYRND